MKQLVNRVVEQKKNKMLKKLDLLGVSLGIPRNEQQTITHTHKQKKLT